MKLVIRVLGPTGQLLLIAMSARERLVDVAAILSAINPQLLPYPRTAPVYLTTVVPRVLPRGVIFLIFHLYRSTRRLHSAGVRAL